MLARIALLLSIGVLSVAMLMSGFLNAPTAQAEGTISPLTFSSQITSAGQPTGDVGIEFGSDNNGVWATFSFENLPPGTQLHRVVRFNYNDDFNWDSDTFGHLNCCSNGGSGRISFPVLKFHGHGGELPGGAYTVII